MPATEGKVAAVNARVQSYPGPTPPECLQKPLDALSAQPFVAAQIELAAILARAVQTTTGQTHGRLGSPILHFFLHALNNMHRKPVFNLGFGPFVFEPARVTLRDPLIA